MTNFIFLSKGGEDEYINMLAASAGQEATNTDFFDYKYDVVQDGMTPVLRGILKYKIMQKCLADGKDFYYVDSGYVGNNISRHNRQGNKLYHRIVRNDLQHRTIVPRPADRWQALDVKLQPRKYGRKIIVAAPDEKPCRYYGIDQQQWVEQTVAKIKSVTDRPIVVRPHPRQRIAGIAGVIVRRPRPLVNTYDSFDMHFNCHAVVNHNSGPGIQAGIAGCRPMVSHSSLAYPVAVGYPDIEQPYSIDRELWLTQICHTEYTVEELKQGLWLKRIAPALTA